MYFKIKGENKNFNAGHLNYDGYGFPIIVVTDTTKDKMHQRRLHTDKDGKLYFLFEGNKYYGEWANNF